LGRERGGVYRTTQEERGNMSHQRGKGPDTLGSFLFVQGRGGGRPDNQRSGRPRGNVRNKSCRFSLGQLPGKKGGQVRYSVEHISRRQCLGVASGKTT